MIDLTMKVSCLILFIKQQVNIYIINYLFYLLSLLHFEFIYMIQYLNKLNEFILLL
jgi:hypothetical protein